MKDTVIKANGKSRIITAPSDMPDTFAAWRAQLLTGEAYLDIALNTALEGDDIGCDIIGTPLNKASFLTDTTKAAIGLPGDDPTPNDAFAALQANKTAKATTTCTLPTSGYSGSGPYTITVTATGATASNLVIPAPAPGYIDAYNNCRAYCSAQGTDTLTFTVTTVPSASITVNVAIFN